jgi:glucose uptake protein
LAIPTTPFSAQLLLIVSFLLLGLWSSTFKMAGNRWRFEVYSFDFAIGAMLFALLSAYTFGAFGADLGFAEHLMISSKTNELLAFFAGGVFALGSMLLLAGTALLGLSFAYAIATATALLVLGGIEFAGYRALFLGAALAAAVLAIIFESLGASSANATLPAASLPIMVRVRKSASGAPAGGRGGKPPQVTTGMRHSTKGILVTIVAGLALGGSLSPFSTSLVGQFGLGTYAGVLVFFGGALVSSLVLGFLLMKIPIHGGPISLKAYLRGTVGQHVLGLIGGALCAAGILILTLLTSFPPDARPDELWLWTAGLGAALLAIALGLSRWREVSQAPGSATRSLMVGAFLLVLAIGAFAMAMDRTAPAPSALLQGPAPATAVPGSNSL